MSLPLQHSAADIARAVLINISAGSDPSSNQDWPIFCAGEPSSPDSVITVYDTAARSDGRIMKDGEQLYHYGIQVRVRTPDHPTGFIKAWSVKRLMDEGVNKNGVYLYNLMGSPYSYFFHCFTNTNVTYIGKENPSTRRTLFTINGFCTLRRIQ